MTGHPMSSIEQLSKRVGAQWGNISKASATARVKKDELTGAFSGLDSTDTSIVAFGSLARNEFTAGSDIDWTLLVDGQAAPEHLDIANKIKDELDSLQAKSPSNEGAFGNLAFSHDIIHQIGGQTDTNANTTQRVLLLLESCVLGRREAYDRVISNVLGRYLAEDRGLWFGSGPRKVPRFLLNDIARYWRTMAVDLAYKQRTRRGVGFGLRTIKLRISRKLIFMAGLLSCFTFELNLSPEERHAVFAPSPATHLSALAHLKSTLQRSPLEILAMNLMGFPLLDDYSRDLFGAYDDFLRLLADDEKRSRLDSLSFDELENDPVFREARQISYRFKDAVGSIFLTQSNPLGELTVEYGVF
jgi:predicted nucleotidyltransferase